MGDMADMLIEQMEEAAYWEAGEPLSIQRPKSRPICKYCGKKNLRWVQVQGKWFLYEKKKPHNCPKCPMTLDQLKKLAEHNKLVYLAEKRERNFRATRTVKGTEQLLSSRIKTTELLDLFEDLVKEHSRGKQLALIRQELLRRLK